jgi:hypothetical protein
MNKFNKAILFSTFILSTSCMQSKPQVLSSVQKATEAIGCSSFKSNVYDSMYDYLDNENEAPQLNDFSAALSEKIDALAISQKIDNPQAVAQLKQNITDLYKVLIEKASELKQTKTSKEHLQTIIEMEMGDVSTTENVQLNQVSAKAFSKVDQAVQQLDVQCGQSSPTAGEEIEEPSSGGSTGGTVDDGVDSAGTVATKSVLKGSRNVLVTAYQSCAVLEIPEMSASTPNVAGIERYGTHSDGVGGQRRVASLSSVQSTHPYIKVAGGAQSGCFNVRSNPLIYDYGGSASVANNIIDFSKNAGSGTSALGVDCSAYVSAAIAAGGLRYKPGVDNKAIYIRQNSSKFINATNSGFTCFKNVTVTPTSTIQPGDILGVNGHVVIVDKVGADPFGIKRLKSASDCNSITSSSNFDFVVSQSSPSKGGVGLNRYQAKDYLKESTKMMTAFVGVAKAACKAYFGGISVATPSSEYGILRHKGTTECMSPKIQMANQSCVSQCMQ